MRRSSTRSSRLRLSPGEPAKAPARITRTPKKRRARSIEPCSCIAVASFLIVERCQDIPGGSTLRQPTTSMGSRAPSSSLDLGCLPPVSATLDPPLWRVRLLDARPSVTRLHALLRKKIRAGRRSIRACNQGIGAPDADQLGAVGKGRGLSGKRAHRVVSSSGLPPAWIKATSPHRGSSARKHSDPAPMRQFRSPLPTVPIKTPRRASR
jgi:hypothetical protein